VRDRFYSSFIDELGEATSSVPVPNSVIDKYSKILPEKLIEYWKEEGWCSFQDGLFWTVNPEDYIDLVEFWIESTLFKNRDNYHAIARTAFGKLYLWGEKTNHYITLSTYHHALIASEENLTVNDDANLELQMFFLNSEAADFDYETESGDFLFAKAKDKLGKLSRTEIYGFEPALILGGEEKVGNLRKVEMIPHLVMLRNFQGPKEYIQE